MNQSTQKKTMNELRLLASLGAGGRNSIPGLLSILQRAIPASYKALLYFDPVTRQLIGGLRDPWVFPMQTELYIEKYFDSDQEVDLLGYTHSQIMSKPAGTIARHNIYQKKYRMNAMANEIFLPTRAANLLAVTLDPNSLGRAAGKICIYRGEKDPDFDSDDVAALKSASEYIGYALSLADDKNELAKKHKATLIANQDGKILNICPDGRRLIALANGKLATGLHPDLARLANLECTLPESLRKLCSTLVDIRSGCDVRPPVVEIKNPWGRFTFQAGWLDSLNPDGKSVVIIKATHHQPLVQLWYEPLRQLPLSQREKQIAFFFAAGLSRSQIAVKAGISSHTVISHIRSIYGKLGIDSRDSLVERFRITQIAKHQSSEYATPFARATPQRSLQ